MQAGMLRMSFDESAMVYRADIPIAGSSGRSRATLTE